MTQTSEVPVALLSKAHVGLHFAIEHANSPEQADRFHQTRRELGQIIRAAMRKNYYTSCPKPRCQTHPGMHCPECGSGLGCTCHCNGPAIFCTGCGDRLPVVDSQISDPNALIEQVAAAIWRDCYPDDDWQHARGLAVDTPDGGDGRYLTIMDHARVAVGAMIAWSARVLK